MIATSLSGNSYNPQTNKSVGPELLHNALVSSFDWSVENNKLASINNLDNLITIVKEISKSSEVCYLRVYGRRRKRDKL